MGRNQGGAGGKGSSAIPGKQANPYGQGTHPSAIVSNAMLAMARGKFHIQEFQRATKGMDKDTRFRMERLREGALDEEAKLGELARRMQTPTALENPPVMKDYQTTAAASLNRLDGYADEAAKILRSASPFGALDPNATSNPRTGQRYAGSRGQTPPLYD
jgi:hypothetical protein